MISPVTEDYWCEWIDLGEDWRGLSQESQSAILALPMIAHVDDSMRPNFNKTKIERRSDVLKLKPSAVGDAAGWLVVCRLMQVYHSAGPIFSLEFDEKKHAEFLGQHVLAETARWEFHRGRVNRYSLMSPKLEIDSARFGSPLRLREFLEIPADTPGTKWEKSWSDGESGSEKLNIFSGQIVTTCACRLLTRIVESKVPVPLQKLSDELAEYHRGGILAKALRSLTNHVLIVVAYDPGVGDLVAGLWPSLRRTMFPQAKASLPSVSREEPEETFGHPFLLDDLAAVVLAAGAEPLPAKQGKLLEIYAAKAKELDRTLVPIPKWVIEGLYQSISRVQIAVGAAYSLGLLVRKTKGLLELSAEGTRWLRLDAQERCRKVLDILMSRSWKKGWHNSNWNFCSVSGRFRGSPYQSDIISMEKGLAMAFRQLPKDGSPVSLQKFLEFASVHHNPLVEAVGRDGFVYLAVPGSYGDWDWKKRDGATLAAEVLPEMRSFLETRLVPLGAVRLGRSRVETTLALTAIGRYFLGATRSLELPREPAAGRIILQPNFEIVFLGPNLRAEAELAPFCERAGAGTGTVFRLTKASIQTALHRGLEVDQMAEILRGMTGRELPKNVLAELTAWAAARQTYSVETVEVLRCGSPEAAQHVHTLLPYNTRILGGSCLEIIRPLRGPEKNRLEKAGFYKANHRHLKSEE